MSLDVADNSAVSASPAMDGAVFSADDATEALVKAAAASDSSPDKPESGVAADTSQKPGGDGTSTSTIPAASGQPVPESKPATGEAPEHRIQAAVANARTQVHQEYEWTKAIPVELRADIPNSLSLLTDLRTDAVAFYKRLGQELQESGMLEGDKDVDLPAPDYKVGENGEEFYSAKQMKAALDAHGKNLMREFNKVTRPIQQHFKETSLLQQRQQRVSQALERARTELYGFADHEDKIAAQLDKLDRNLKMQDPERALRLAHSAVMQVEQANLEKTVEERLRKSLDKKVAASVGSAHPAGGVTGGQKKPALETEDDLAAHMERLAAAG